MILEKFGPIKCQSPETLFGEILFENSLQEVHWLKFELKFGLNRESLSKFLPRWNTNWHYSVVVGQLFWFYLSVWVELVWFVWFLELNTTPNGRSLNVDAHLKV